MLIIGLLISLIGGVILIFGGNFGMGLVLLLLGVCLWWVWPVYVAIRRKNEWWLLILIVDLFFGFSTIGWMGCLLAAYMFGEPKIRGLGW